MLFTLTLFYNFLIYIPTYIHTYVCLATYTTYVCMYEMRAKIKVSSSLSKNKQQINNPPNIYVCMFVCMHVQTPTVTCTSIPLICWVYV